MEAAVRCAPFLSLRISLFPDNVPDSPYKTCQESRCGGPAGFDDFNLCYLFHQVGIAKFCQAD
jgi:hypothetical protein